MCTVCMKFPHRPEEGIRSLVLELPMVTWHYVGDGNGTQVLIKSTKCS